MPNLSELLDRKSKTVDLREGAFGRLVALRQRRQRNRRVGAGVLAVVVMAAASVVLLRAFRFEPTPADQPTPTVAQPAPRDMGDLAYIQHGDVYVANWDGTDAMRIADGGECPPGEVELFAEGGMWSPDGNYVAYRQWPCGQPSEDWGNVVISDRDGTVLARFHSAGWRISWSPDSSRVAVWAQFEQTIGIYDVRGARHALLKVPDWWRPAGDTDPEWSPDGASVIAPGSGSRTAEIPLDGSPPRRLPWSYPTFSPDGSHVVYFTRESLVVANADGSHPQDVPDTRQTGRPVWSPTGAEIAFASYSEPWPISVFDVATGTVTTVVQPTDLMSAAPAAESQYISPLDFSPDGDWLLFARSTRHPRSTSAWAISIDGSGLRLIADGVHYSSPDWRSVSSKTGADQ